MSGTAQYNPYDPEAASRAGLFEGLSRLGAALTEAGRPRLILREGYGPGLLGGLAQGLGGFSQGMREGRRGYMAQQQEEDALRSQNLFREATGNGPDDALSPQAREIRQRLGANRATFGLLGPQAGMAALAQTLTRENAPQVLAPGAALFQGGQEIARNPERPPAAQWVGTPETGYGWAVPPPRGGGAPMAPPAAGGAPGGVAPQSGAANPYGRNTGLVAARDAVLDAPPAAAAAATAARLPGVLPANVPYAGRPENAGPVIPNPDFNPAAPEGANNRRMIENPWHGMRGQLAGSTGRVAALDPNAPRIPGFTPVIPPRGGETYAIVPPTEYERFGLPTPGEGRVWQRNTRTGQVVQAGANPGVTVNTGDNAFDRKRGDEIATTIGSIERAGREAPAALRRFDSFERSLVGFTTGAGSETVLKAGQIAQRLGVPDSVLNRVGLDRNATAQGENIRSIAGQMVIGALQSGQFPTQNLSDGDRQFLQSINPGLANSPDGNRLLLAAGRAVAMRDMEVAAAWREWQMRNGVTQQSANRFQNEVLPELLARPLLDDATRNGLERFVGDGQPSASVQADPPPSAAGQTIINRQTGQRMRLQGNQWVPVQ